MLALAATTESGSEHPLASAVLDYAAAVLDNSAPFLRKPSPSYAVDRFKRGPGHAKQPPKSLAIRYEASKDCLVRIEPLRMGP